MNAYTFNSAIFILPLSQLGYFLTLLYSERPKLYTILAFLSALGLKKGLRVYLFWTALTVLGKKQSQQFPSVKNAEKEWRCTQTFGVSFRVPGMYLNRSKYHSASGVHSLVKLHLKHEGTALPLQSI